MYTMEIDKFGIKQYYSSKIIAKLYLKMKSTVKEMEIEITDNDIKTIQTFTKLLKPLKINHTQKLIFGQTNIKILKSELLTEHLRSKKVK